MPTSHIFIICSKAPKCDGPGVAEYQFGLDLSKHKCGFCDAELRAATEKEIDAYKKANPTLHPVQEEESE